MRDVPFAVWLFLLLLLPAACEKSPEDARKELGQLGLQYSPEVFLTSVTNNDLRAVQLFLTAGMDPNTTVPSGIPALLTATMNCDGSLRQDKTTHTAMAQALISHGANVNVTRKIQPPQLTLTGERNWTPLLLATRLDCQDLMHALLKHGANVNAADEYGRTPLIEAATRGFSDAVSILLEAGANVEAKTKTDERTALILAATEGHTDIVRILLDRQANIDTQDRDGQTALIISAARGHSDVVRLLLERGADVNARDRFENTALRNAEKYGGPEVTQILRLAGAK